MERMIIKSEDRSREILYAMVKHAVCEIQMGFGVIPGGERGQAEVN